jgi:hypothetical protein
MRAVSAQLGAALAIAILSALANPALTLGVVLACAGVVLVLGLPRPQAIAISWGLAVIPLNLNLPGVPFPIPLDVPVGCTLAFRAFIVEGVHSGFGTRLDNCLAGIVLTSAVLSAAISPDVLRASLHTLRLAIWLLYIPIARAWYTQAADVLPSLTALAITLGVQAVIGFAQVAFGEHVATGLMTSPLAQVFFNANALAGRLAIQDYNWILFDRAFASGLFLNSIAFGLCLAIGGLIILTVPEGWFPDRQSWIWRAFGVASLVCAVLSLKVTAWLALLAGSCCLVMMRMSVRRVGAMRAAVPMLFVALGALFVQGLIGERIRYALSVTLGTRLIAWTTYLGHLRHAGVLGSGLGLVEVQGPTLPTYAAGQPIELVIAPENSWIALAVEIGIPATVALLLLLSRLAAHPRPFRLTWAAPAVVAGIVGGLGVHAITDEHIFPLIALIGGSASAISEPEGT